MKISISFNLVSNFENWITSILAVGAIDIEVKNGNIEKQSGELKMKFRQKCLKK